MKKTLITLLSAMAILGMTACGDSDCDDDTSCPVADAGIQQDASTPEEDAAVPEEDAAIPQTDTDKALDALVTVVDKGMAVLSKCIIDGPEISQGAKLYMPLVEGVAPVIKDALNSGNVKLDETLMGCVAEATAILTPVLEKASSDCGELDTLVTYLTTEKAPNCTSIVKDLALTEGDIDISKYVVGVKANGEGCVTSLECKEGFCVGNTVATCGGVCVPYLSKGDPCNAGLKDPCAEGLNCIAGVCSDGKDGSYCDGNRDCADNYRCYFDTCVPVLGSSCTWNDDCYDRQEGTYCDGSTGKCAGQKTIGAGCNGAAECLSGRCVSDESSTVGGFVCTDKLSAGAVCHGDSDCKSDECVCPDEDEAKCATGEVQKVCAEGEAPGDLPFVPSFPGDKCEGLAEDSCITECDTSLEVPVCKDYTVAQVGAECKDSQDCSDLPIRMECFGYKRHWDSAIGQTVVDQMGKCSAPLFEGETCTLDNDGDSMCRSDLKCLAKEAGSTEMTCQKVTVGVGALCGSIDGKYVNCDPAVGFCDTVVKDGCDPTDTASCEEHRCVALKANYQLCQDGEECASGYCDNFLPGGSSMCLDVPDLSTINVCTVEPIINFMGGGRF